MIKFFPERQDSDLYSPEIIDEIYQEMGLKTKLQRQDLKEILEESAIDFIKDWEAEKLKKTEKQDFTAIEKTLPHLKKCKEIYELIDAGGTFISTGFGSNKSVFFKPAKYAMALRQIIEETEAVLADPLRSRNKTKTRLVLNWIWSLSDIWEASEITLSEGRCEQNGEYRSEAMKILTKMMGPIKKRVNDPSVITSSLIAEAIKENRLYNEQGYLAANSSKSSGVIGSKSNPKVLKTIDFRE